MKHYLLGIGVVLITAQLACGSESATYVAPPMDGQAGLSYDSALQALLDENFEADGPAVVVLVDSPEGHFVAARGMNDIYEETPADVGGRFRIGSVSKTMLAAALLDMVDDGLISLDDTMMSRLPSHITDNIPYSDRITVRQMLNMTRGSITTRRAARSGRMLSLTCCGSSGPSRMGCRMSTAQTLTSRPAKAMNTPTPTTCCSS
jgi:D-alanyl-D-alanine carboxypeptidase